MSKKRQIKNVQLEELAQINAMQEEVIHIAYMLIFGVLRAFDIRENLDLRERSEGSKPSLEEWENHLADVKKLTEAGKEWIRMVHGDINVKD